MKWMRIKVRTRVEAEDLLVAALYDVGLKGAQIEDSVPLTAAEKEQMFVDILPDAPVDDGTALLSFYLEEDEAGRPLLEDADGEKTPADPEEILRAVRETIAEYAETEPVLNEAVVTVEETEDLDWINNWKQFFHQFEIDDLLFIPSWESPEKDPAGYTKVFHIDPGTAFGTGMHETTKLCIRGMRPYIHEDTKVLDIGTGSGILGILALMLGAREAVGTDLDPCAEPAVRENLASNGVDPDKFRFYLGDLITDTELQAKVGGDYPIVLANILAPVLVALCPAVAKCLAPGGVFITSGIMEGYEGMVQEAMKAQGLEVLETRALGEWRSVTGRKPL